MNRKTLGVVFGGQSSEYSVSLHSAASFLRALHKDRYNLVMIGISKDGEFYLYDGDIDHIEHDEWQLYGSPCAWVHKGVMKIGDEHPIFLDAVFPILHGKNGEDGAIQGLLQMLDIHCVGADVLASAMCMDKEIMHILLEQAGIPAADYLCIREGKEINADEVEAEIPLPWVVKPCNAGSSYGVSFVEKKEELPKALKEAFKYDGRQKALIEKAVDGFEIGCAVMGNEEPFAGSVDEIEIKGHLFDFDGKYEMADAAIHCPARITKEQFENARELAKKAYQAMNCQGMSRVDMFVQKDGSIIINEINTIPGFTDTSRYPTMMKEAGKNFPDLIDELVDLAMEKPVGVC